MSGGKYLTSMSRMKLEPKRMNLKCWEYDDDKKNDNDEKEW